MKKNYCVILGGGGHSKVLIETIFLQKKYIPKYILDPNKELWGKEIFGIKVSGPDDELEDLKKKGIDYFVVGVGSIKDNYQRKMIYEKAINLGFKPTDIIHPNAIISKTSKIGRGSQILAGAILNTESEIGENVLINTGAIIEHNCILKNHIHISIGAKIASTVIIEDLAFVGAGAVLKQNIRIGEGAIIGAGAVVLSDVPPFKTFIGVPAKEKI